MTYNHGTVIQREAIKEETVTQSILCIRLALSMPFWTLQGNRGGEIYHKSPTETTIHQKHKISNYDSFSSHPAAKTNQVLPQATAKNRARR